jgi:hypothetical protein
MIIVMQAGRHGYAIPTLLPYCTAFYLCSLYCGAAADVDRLPCTDGKYQWSACDLARLDWPLEGLRLMAILASPWKTDAAEWRLGLLCVEAGRLMVDSRQKEVGSDLWFFRSWPSACALEICILLF